MLKRIIPTGFLFVFILSVSMVLGQGFYTKDDIIKQLGGVSATKEVKVPKTRELKRIDKSIEPETKNRGLLNIPKHIVVRLLFKMDSAEFADHRSAQQLAQLGLAFSSDELAHIKVEIAGHTCDLGSDEHNLVLSQRRAERVMKDLVMFYQIDPSRITAVGYGETSPHVQNNSESNRKLNRRVVIKRLE